MRVEVRNLVRRFGRTTAVDHINFDFESGDIYGFVGPNGAGKTTTMRIMATLDEPCDGDIYVDGVSLINYPEKVRQWIGFMPDSLPAHHDISVAEYIDFFARAYGLRGARRRKAVEGVLDFTNLQGIRWKMLSNLSKGMKQRVSLARSIVHDPAVLVMDEPAAGLDPRARVELRELLKILRQQGKAVLISSHILTELSEICTGAVIIEQGRILRAGSVSELINSGNQDGKREILVIVLDCDSQTFARQLLEMPLIDEAFPVDLEDLGAGRGTGWSGSNGNGNGTNGNQAIKKAEPSDGIPLADGGIVAEIVEATDITLGAAHVRVDPDPNVSASLLKLLIERGYRVLEFTPRHIDLEDVFMSLTQGNVQ